MRSVAILLLSVSASASGWEEGPCAPDVKKFCAGVEKGTGAVIRCLKAHEAELSSACRQKREEKIKRPIRRESQPGKVPEDSGPGSA